jgi:UDP-N-acetylglucosamine/UDP-N-acetylgalactosamine diphosphorylase
VIPNDLQQRLRTHGQEHLEEVYERLDESGRANFLREVERIDLAELVALYEKREHKDALPERLRIQTLPHPVIDANEREALQKRGIQAFQRGEVAFLMVAGGQGTRLGCDDPKGMFPIGPISRKSLFQIHAEKVLALCRRFGAKIPFLIMTSPATDAPTRKYFAAQQNFGLPEEDVWYFCQGTMPALDLATGRLLLDAPGRLCLSPNGHGGTITGLCDSGILDRLEKHGVSTISYFQVDNPLTKLGDFLFVGRHLAEEAEVSSKVLPKTGPKEKVGNFLLVDGRCAMIEYSDLPDEWTLETDAKGELTFWAGNPAIHLFDVDFLRRITAAADRLPWHLARKKVAHLHEKGHIVTPQDENALKFERFIFDVLPHAERWTVLPTQRAEEFAPVKNKDGVDSPATAQAMMVALAARWLHDAGVEVSAHAKLEVSPLFALDAEELRAKVKAGSRIERDTYFG